MTELRFWLGVRLSGSAHGSRQYTIAVSQRGVGVIVFCFPNVRTDLHAKWASELFFTQDPEQLLVVDCSSSAGEQELDFAILSNGIFYGDSGHDGQRFRDRLPHWHLSENEVAVVVPHANTWWSVELFDQPCGFGWT